MELSDGRLVFGELVIDGGRLWSFQVEYMSDMPGGHLMPFRGALSKLRATNIWFTEPWNAADGIAPRNLSVGRSEEARRVVEPGAPATQLNRDQDWLLSLDKHSVCCPDRRLPLRFRRA